jgi:hypothetical protein
VRALELLPRLHAAVERLWAAHGVRHDLARPDVPPERGRARADVDDAIILDHVAEARARERERLVGGERARLNPQQGRVDGRVARRAEGEGAAKHSLVGDRRIGVARPLAHFDLDVEGGGNHTPRSAPQLRRHRLGVADDARGRAAVDGAGALHDATGHPMPEVGAPQLDGVPGGGMVGGEACTIHREPLRAKLRARAEGEAREDGCIERGRGCCGCDGYDAQQDGAGGEERRIRPHHVRAKAARNENRDPRGDGCHASCSLLPADPMCAAACLLRPPWSPSLSRLKGLFR